MGVIDSLIVFIVSLLIGALGIYVGARITTDTDDYSHALVTALIGAIVWVIISFFFGWIPFLGPILALLAYIAIINWRYPGGWVSAITIALIAWAAAFIILYVLSMLGITTFEAMGVPGL